VRATFSGRHIAPPVRGTSPATAFDNRSSNGNDDRRDGSPRHAPFAVDPRRMVWRRSPRGAHQGRTERRQGRGPVCDAL